MNTLKVAGAQMAVTTDVTANTETILRAIDWARDEGAALLLTPEGALSGYTPRFDRAQVHAALQIVTARAHEARLALALGTCYEEADGLCYNEVRLYARDGRYLGFHAKTLRCGTLDEPPLGELNDYATQPLRTFDVEGVCLGALICNDLWANPDCTPEPDPHLTQQLSRMGARVILHAVNGGRDGTEWSDVAWQYHEANLRMRARAGAVWIVTVDNCEPARWRCASPSGVVDPQGNWAHRAWPQGEHFWAYTLQLD